jgi:hypothetical protein
MQNRPVGSGGLTLAFGAAAPAEGATAPDAGTHHPQATDGLRRGLSQLTVSARDR